MVLELEDSMMKLTYHLGGFILGILQLPDRGQFGNHGAGASQMLQGALGKLSSHSWETLYQMG